MTKKCVRCKREFPLSVMLSPAKITESGKIIYPNENERMSIQMPVDLCFHCMNLVNEGFIILVERNDGFEFVELSDNRSDFSIRFFEERAREGKLKGDIEESLEKLKVTRKEVKKQKLKNSPLRIAVLIDESLESYQKFIGGKRT